MTSQPNFLLITTDQQRFDTIGAAGNPSIWTPHLDWLCHTGIRYSRAYADCPICAPSRATIMTGLKATSHGQIGNSGLSPMAKFPTLPAVLTQNGYQTRAEGKMHFAPTRANYGFEHMRILPDYYREMARKGGPQPKQHGIGENELAPVFSSVPAQDSVTNWTAEKSIDFLETRDETRPFFLWTSFSKPHPPFDAPREWWDIYDGIPMPEPIYGDWSADLETMPQGFLSPTRSLGGIDRRSAAQIRNIRRAYYACISHVDYTLGLLFSRMRELGLLENTWIFFTSDHGEMLGDHHLCAKSMFFEGSAHVPFLVRPPANASLPAATAGGEDARLMCLADLMPTILDLANIQSPPSDGLSFLGDQKREQFTGQNGSYHMLIEGRWKFIFSEIGGHELLFDLAADPMETRNLLDEAPEQATKLRQTLADSLEKRGHKAVQNGKLVATSEVPSEQVQRSRSWPGFHSRGDQNCDLLH